MFARVWASKHDTLSQCWYNVFVCSVLACRAWSGGVYPVENKDSVIADFLVRRQDPSPAAHSVHWSPIHYNPRPWNLLSPLNNTPWHLPPPHGHCSPAPSAGCHWPPPPIFPYSICRWPSCAADETLTLTTQNYFCLSMEIKGFFSFEIFINDLVSSFLFIWILMLWVYGQYKYCNSYSAGTVFI